MAEIWAAAAVVVGAGVSAYSQNKAAKTGAKAQRDAANGAIAASQENYDKTAANLNPYISAGTSALGQMNALNAGDFSSFKASPDYQFAMDQGLQGLDRSAAARGSLFSGGHSADIMGYAQGLASQQYGNYYNRIAGLAQSGQNAASNLGSVGTNNAAAIGANLTNAGNATANGAQNQANNTSQFANTVSGAFNQWYGNQPPQTASSYGSSTLSGGTSYDAGNGFGYGGGSYNLNGGPTNTSPWQVGAR